ncbi:MAG: altronate dehydratase family protein [Anaerolineae bacterium]|nr:altronate dehydratase family protein [Anaerolineae bacterium]
MLFSQVAIQLDSNDDVAIAKTEIARDTILQMPHGDALTIRDHIPVGHKFALHKIDCGAMVRRYGQPIGIATQTILPGDWVHTHNLTVGNITTTRAYRVVDAPRPEPARRTFLGYRRADGRVGTRNYIAVIASANCAANVAIHIARAFDANRLANFPNVDGVIPIVHSAGCSDVLGSLSHRHVQRTLANVARHPNIGAAIAVGLGCEENQIATCFDLTQMPGFVIQEQGGFRKTVDAGIRAVEELLPRVNACARTPQPISALTIALQCGGSDSWSGVTANPLVGSTMDKIIAQGGTAILAETPEIFGAEALLLNRVASAEVAHKLIARLDWWSEQARLLGFSVDNNHTPGNKVGGLTTILEKSLGAVAKGGSTPLMAVYEYAERIDARGLVFMDTPGNDPTSVTGELAGGCNLIVFTTGRGSLFGSHIAPCIKVASNSELFARMSDDMDFNAGKILEDVTMQMAAEELLEQIIAVASGARTKSEQHGTTEAEFVIWRHGATM